MAGKNEFKKEKYYSRPTVDTCVINLSTTVTEIFLFRHLKLFYNTLPTRISSFISAAKVKRSLRSVVGERASIKKVNISESYPKKRRKKWAERRKLKQDPGNLFCRKAAALAGKGGSLWEYE